MSLNFDIRGIPEIKQLLEEMAPKHATALLRNTNYGIASEARKRIRAAAPRESGDMAKSISVRNERGTEPRTIVYFKPAGFYWRFVEHGTQERRGHPFVTPAVEQVRAALPEIAVNAFERAMSRRINAELKKQAKRR